MKCKLKIKIKLQNKQKYQLKMPKQYYLSTSNSFGKSSQNCFCIEGKVTTN